MNRRLLASGAAVVGVAWFVRPLLDLPPFAGHMAMHMAVVAVAAPLLALGLAGSPLDPARRWPTVVSAIPASVVELVAVWAWHTPALHHWARHDPLGLVAEQGTFLLAGLWLWSAALGGTPAQRRERSAAGVTGLLLTSMHMTLLGALLVLTPRALFGHGGGWGLSPAQDQHLGGAIMLLVGGVAYSGGALWLTARVLRHRSMGAS